VETYKYVIVGAGLGGSSAADGIRESDPKGSILLIGREPHIPYDRPPLTKKLWFGTKKVEEIFLHSEPYWNSKGVTLSLKTEVTAIDPRARLVRIGDDRVIRYDKLLLATGGAPKRLPIPGGDQSGICYYRTLDDYQRIRAQASENISATVIGGGFIGSELAAALTIAKVKVRWIFRDAYPGQRLYPESLGRSLLARFQEKGVQVLTGDVPTSIAWRDGRYVTSTRGGEQIASDMVIAGIGIRPEMELARAAELATGNGIVVDERLRTADPYIWAAGDNAFFPYGASGKHVRVEHWDNSLSQGRCAGHNMAGANELYTHLPYFFSDLFELGYEAVGDVNAKLDMVTDWVRENEEGVVYYLSEGRVQGVLLCNIWGKVDAARELLRKGGARMTPDELRGFLR
jgi:NADPH-dependent 2,4-dienoyl-CoA reductase/sulfur reductase-like enzyme